MPVPNDQASQPKLYSAPRKFDLATMLVITTAYAILFAGMKALNFGVAPFAVFAGFISFVGIAQSLFSNWNRPRLVSILCGMLWYASFAVYEIIASGSYWYLASFVFEMIFSGIFLGYFCGALVGGVFLVSEFFRTTFLGSAPSGEYQQADTTQESPWHSDEES